MCGLVVQIGSLPSEAQKSKALQILKNRGPDGEGEHSSIRDKLWMGHTRLAIVDPQNSHQPISNTSRTIVAVVNGEFYDDSKIRQGLERKGHHFKGKCDSEILIHLYEEYGAQALEHLRGEFAFVLWDKKKRRVFAARDRFGIKPLYYNFDTKTRTLRLGSSSKSFFALGVKAEWNVQALAHIYDHQYPQTGAGLFSSIHLLKPGEYLIAQGDSPPIVSPYWEIPSHQELKESTASELFDALNEAVKIRLRGECAIGMYLSGGIDSATILHFANKNAATPLSCFGVSFANKNYDESYDAKRLAYACGSPFQAVEASNEKMLAVLEDAVWHAEQVCINGQLPAKHLLSKYVSNAGYKVVLSGEGADEALWGYPHLKQDWLKTIPEKRRRIYESQLFNTNRLSKGIMLSRTSNSTVPAFLSAKMEFGDHIRPLLSSEGLEWQAHFRPREQIKALVKQKAQQYSPIELGAYLWSKLALSGYILRAIGDGMEMRHGIEGRPPFLDHLLFTQCVALPNEQKIHQGIEKYALREMMRPHLPQWICDKAKHPFIAPPIGFFRDSKHHSWLKNHLLEEPPPGISKTALETWVLKATRMNKQEQDQLESVVFLLLSTRIIQSKIDEHTHA